MTITLGIAWALFILAPGLAVFAALYTSDGGVVSPAPPAPNSFTALSVVIFGALAAHAVGAGLFALNDVISLFWSPLEVPWNPNPYAYFLSARPAVDRHLGLEICFLLALLLSLSAAAYAAVRHTVDQDEKVSVKRRRLDPPEPPTPLFRFLYGSWAAILTQLSPEPDYDKHLAAYIVTDMEAEKGWIGYEGEVEGVALDTDKQIVALTLRNCQAFKLQPTKDNLNHQVIARAAAIPLLMIDRSQIKNVALQVVFQQKP
ncbi:MAG: hypothetical protein KJ728_04315 [Alphaproteobacteria bacterium]|uniref:hypothetical protein n=1 Tax=Brevundimonas sp. TaxID=1871086 RepID=UPI001A228546|nr:hypothetical protein [Brevundimonas sp.]MBU1271050.1 hypothetical protein [Alphaproteobacteria bacterium]MBJ7319911.1 hypothetical protein [Brevundimonas sp.]MBU1520628.1 hypothetical protein [Alphaproteobacteria bacterium]MBU2031851.1 hypothetical protein [Alphaproteobacteria bacterium]MBU2165205.1 hypothetical protein [Alphaproteobacteria bacterium]